MPTTHPLLKFHWQTTLPEYVTAIAWSPDGQTLGVGTAAGDVVLYAIASGSATVLQAQSDRSIDTLAFSADGQFLATGGQDGSAQIWSCLTESPQLIQTLREDRVWVDRLAWHPTDPELAISFGRSVQVWNVATQTQVATLDFEASSVLDLAWHPQGEHLSVAGHRAIKTWRRQAWDTPPEERETSAAIEAIAWSSDGRYLAAGNHDRTLLVWEMGNPAPWQMQGFPGKVRQLAWPSDAKSNKLPLLASISAEEVIIWQKEADPNAGWAAQPLSVHMSRVVAIAFQPGSRLLASAADDGTVCLCKSAHTLIQRLQGAPGGFACLAWHPQGQYLAAGGQQGELITWAIAPRGRGFGT